MSNNVAIKAEINEEEEEGSNTNPIPFNSVAQDSTTSDSHMLDDPTLLSALLENEEDEIIREIDVYISPELVSTMHLIQFPLQPASNAATLLPSDKNKPNNNDPKNKPFRPPPPPLPVAARIKPQNALLELDYKIPTSSFSSQRQIPAPLSLGERTHASHNIPMVTHMALGLFDNTNSKIDLIPIHRIMQMRPTFSHVDALFEDPEEAAAEQANKDAQKNKDDTAKPIMFQKPESERAIMARKTSYAFKKANEESEEWIDLDVHGFGSLARKEMLKKAYCAKSARENNLTFVKNGKTGGNTGYVKSLNYLPTTVIETDVEDFIIDENENGLNAIDLAGGTVPEWKKELTTLVATLLQGRGGMPIPYAVIRSRFQPSIPDSTLLEALSASAVLVRGNFLLKSSLMALSNKHIENARDVVLILMIKYGFIQRVKLYEAFQDADDDTSDIVTKDVINGLLELMGRKTVNGMEMKIDDDLYFESKFPDIAKLHAMYWEKRELKLEKYIQLYQ